MTTPIDSNRRTLGGRSARRGSAEAFAEGVAQFLGRRGPALIHVYSAVVAFIAGAALVSVSCSVQSTAPDWPPSLHVHHRGDVHVSGVYHG
jgi:hemolysin III